MQKEVQEKAEAEKRRLEREAKQETIGEVYSITLNQELRKYSKNPMMVCSKENGANSGTATI